MSRPDSDFGPPIARRTRLVRARPRPGESPEIGHFQQAAKGNRVIGNVSTGGKWDGVHSDAREYVHFENNWTDADLDFGESECDREKMQFALPDDSPVYKKVPGFKKIPFEKIGL